MVDRKGRQKANTERRIQICTHTERERPTEE